MLCMETCALFALLGSRKGMRWSVGLLLFEYIFLLYATTVVFRKTKMVESHLLTPFWSYQTIWEGNEQLSTQAVMNVIAFVLVGLLWPIPSKELNGGVFCVLVDSSFLALKYSNSSFIAALLNLMFFSIISLGAWLALDYILQ